MEIPNFRACKSMNTIWKNILLIALLVKCKITLYSCNLTIYLTTYIFSKKIVFPYHLFGY